jgi:putative transposase
MPRPLRSFEPLAIYHLIPRFVGGEWFIQCPEEREMYLELVGEGLAGSTWRCMAFAVMSNHIHFAMRAGEGNVDSWLHDAHTQFAEYINRRDKRIGGVFVRGPGDHRIAPDAVARLIGYVHRNPVRAGVVDDARDSDWTSHRAYLGDSPRPRWLDTALGMRMAGFQDSTEMDNWIRETDIDRKQMRDALFRPPRRVGRPEWMPPAVRIWGPTPFSDKADKP